MASKPESRFIARINAQLPLKKVSASAKARKKYGIELHYEKMCNPFRGGTADSWYSGNFGDLWVEYKYLERLPLRARVAPQKLLSPLQLDWLGGRYDEGRNVAVVIGCPEGGVVLLDRAWERDIQTFRPVSLPDLVNWILSSTVRRK